MRLTGKVLGAALLVGAALLGGTGAASAASKDQFDAQNWKPAYDPYGYFTVEGAKRMDFLQIHAALTFSWAKNPVQLSQPRVGAFGGRNVIRNFNIVDITAAIGLISFGKTAGLTIGLDVPYSLYTDGIKVNPDPVSNDPQHIRPGAFGDVRAGLKLTLLDREEDLIGIAAKVDVTIPTGRSDQFLSNGYRLLTPTFTIIVEKKWKLFRAGVNVGYEYLYRDLRFAGITVSDKLKLGAALEITPFDAGPLKPLSIVGEIFHWARIGNAWKAEAEAPLEAGGGIKYTSTFFAELGANAGLNQGVGAPDVRVFVSIGLTF